MKIDLEHVSTVEPHTEMPLALYMQSPNADIGECISRYPPNLKEFQVFVIFQNIV